MPAVPSSIIEPIWRQFEALIPSTFDTHPLGCHRPRVADRIVFDKLVQVLVLGAAYVKIADSGCSATTIRRRRDEWITAGIFTQLEQICLESYDKMIGLELEDLSVLPVTLFDDGDVSVLKMHISLLFAIVTRSLSSVPGSSS